MRTTGLKHKRRGLFFRLLLSIISGGLFIFAFPPFNLWLFAFFSLVPLIFAGKENDGKNFFFGLIAGLIFYSASFLWLSQLAGPLYLFLALYLSLYWGVFLYLVFALPEKNRIFIAGSLWFLLEIITSHLLTGFPWLSMGLSQWNCPYILKASSFIGIFGLSFLVITGNFTLFYSFRKTKILSWSFSVLCFIALVFSPLFTIPVSNNHKNYLNVLIIQPNINSSINTNYSHNIEKIKNLTSEELKKNKADIVIWPEGAYPDTITQNPELLDDLQTFTKKHSVGLILGSFTGNDKIYNSALLIEGERIQTHNKTHLAPYGEFIPGGRLKIISSLFEKLAGYIPYIEQSSELTPFSFKDINLGVLICFENIFPEISNSLIEKEMGIFIVITNDSWFGYSAGPYQHFAHNSIRAVETGRYFIISALSGISGIVAPDGTVKAIVKDNGESLYVNGSVFYAVPVLQNKTIYTITGDIPMFLLSVLFIGVAICRTRQKK